MKYFKLPDLGEGLAEAEICQWFVNAGDTVTTDQLLVSVETAKAIVEIPAPCDGTIAALFGEPGDVVHVGEPLVEFAGAAPDSGTVVGEIGSAPASATEDRFIIGSAHRHGQQAVRATPAVRALAERLGVDVASLKPTSASGMVTLADVERAGELEARHGPSEPLRGVRRAMARNMSRAHAEVVPVSLFEDADVHDWPEDADTTVRLALALAAGCRASPALNAWFDGHAESRRLFEHVDLGIAVNTDDGLFVPVLRNVGGREAADLRTGLDRLRADVRARSIPPQEMVGATITLSNFGALGGRYGTPVVVPPTVAILGAGAIRLVPAVHEGEICARRVLPLSLTFDHRAVTGAEAAGFLMAVVNELQGGAPAP